jgi:hypothetical protein
VPLQGCCDHQFELILFVNLTKAGKIRHIRTGVYRSYSPSAIEEMDAEFFQHDLEHATKALEEVLTSEQATPRHPRRSRRDALDVAVLKQLVGTSVRQNPAQGLVKKFGLIRTGRGTVAASGTRRRERGCRLSRTGPASSRRFF